MTKIICSIDYIKKEISYLQETIMPSCDLDDDSFYEIMQDLSEAYNSLTKAKDYLLNA